MTLWSLVPFSATGLKTHHSIHFPKFTLSFWFSPALKLSMIQKVNNQFTLFRFKNFNIFFIKRINHFIFINSIQRRWALRKEGRGGKMRMRECASFVITIFLRVFLFKLLQTFLRVYLFSFNCCVFFHQTMKFISSIFCSLDSCLFFSWLCSRKLNWPFTTPANNHDADNPSCSRSFWCLKFNKRKIVQLLSSSLPPQFPPRFQKKLQYPAFFHHSKLKTKKFVSSLFFCRRRKFHFLMIELCVFFSALVLPKLP